MRSVARSLANSVARLGVLLVVPPALLLAIAYKTEPIGSSWLELLQYVPYPAFLLPAVLALALSFLLGRWWRMAAALALGLVVTVIMGLALGHADAGGKRVRLMTYNVKAYNAGPEPGAFDALGREIAAHAPDIVVMQDAAELTARRAATPGLAASIFADREVYQSGQYIVVSRYPLRDCRAADLSFRGQGHTYARCTVVAEGVEFDLFTAHLLSPRRGLNATRHEGAEGIDDWQQNFNDRLMQSRKLADDVSLRRRPLVVAGDLNAPETSPVIRTLLDRGLRDAYSSAGRGYGYTHGHSLRPGISFLRIDHILVSPEIGVQDARTGGKEASEHRPVIADLLLEREPG